MSRITVTGLGGILNSPTTFENVYRAVSAEGMSLVISNCRVLGCNSGIYSGRIFGAAKGVFQINIHHNRIENACFTGIQLKSTMPSRSVIVADNWIAFNNTDILCQGKRHGIIVENGTAGGAVNLGDASRYHILRNRVRNEASFTSSGGLVGIMLRDVIGIIVEGNIIEDMISPGLAFAFKGIELSHAPYSQLKENQITGNNIDYTIESAGVFNLESNNTLMLCNSTHMVDRGITFKGLACDATDFNSNTIKTHQEGLFLANNTVMGDQISQNNIWVGSAGQVEGKFIFPEYDPTIQDHKDFVARSFFSINIANELSVMWANPRLIDNNPDNDPQNGYKWFKSNGGYPGLICSYGGPRGLTNSDIKVINGSLSPHGGYASTIWEASYHTYTRLLKDAGLRPTSSTALTWYYNYYNSSFAQLSRVEHDMNLIGLPSSATIIADSALTITLQLSAAKEQEWINAANPTLAAQKLQELLLLNASVLTAQNMLNSELLNDQNIAFAQKQALLNTLNSLTFTELHGQDLRTVLRIFLESNIGEIPYTITQQAELNAIAAKCRLPGGYGVVLARTALGNLGETHSVDLTCGTGNRGRSEERETTKAIESRVWPNPTDGTLQIQWFESVEKANVSLHNLLGESVRNWQGSGTSLNIEDLGNLPPGMYLLNIVIPGKEIASHKVIISR